MVGVGAGPGLLLTSPDIRFGARAELAAPIGFLGLNPPTESTS